MLTAIMVAQNTLASSPRAAPPPTTSVEGTVPTGTSDSSSTRMHPKCAILSGAAWPNPYGNLFHELAAAAASATSASTDSNGAITITTTTPTLHCWGTEDVMNPPELAQKLQVIEEDQEPRFNDFAALYLTELNTIAVFFSY